MISAKDTKESRKVNATKNYRLFGRSQDNRPMELKKHKKLLLSMKKYGFLPCYPIICYRDKSKSLVVKDGQHRLAIAETLGLTVYWVETSEDFDVAIINCTPKTWALSDYARKWAEGGRKNYQELQEFAEMHGLPVGISVAMLSGQTSFHSTVADAFYTGGFKVTDRAWADRVASTYGPLVRLAPDIRNGRLLLACMSACRVPKFDPERLLRNARRVREKLVPYSTRDAYLDMIEEVYNYGQKALLGVKALATMAMRERSPINNKKK